MQRLKVLHGAADSLRGNSDEKKMFYVKSTFLKSAIPDHSHVFHLFILYLLKANAFTELLFKPFSVKKKTKQTILE